MSNRFTPVRVREVRPETADAYTIVFDAPQEWYDYLPGQYLTLSVDVAGENFRRAFSLSSAPALREPLSVTIKAIPDGRVSPWLKQNLKAGDTIDLFPPMGKFVIELDEDAARRHVLIGGGSGITPLMSMLKSVLVAEPMSTVVLLYGNRDQESIIFRDELARLEARYPDRLSVTHILAEPKPGWDGLTGLLDAAMLADLLSDVGGHGEPTTYYMCGPDPMMTAADAALRGLGVPADAIKREYYSAPVAGDDEDEIDYDLKYREVEIILDGLTHIVPVDAGVSVLEACKNAGLDPPYACEEGICSTCRGKLYEGLVSLEIREGLSDEELEAGYILTCQSFPLTDDVKIEFA